MADEPVSHRHRRRRAGAWATVVTLVLVLVLLLPVLLLPFTTAVPLVVAVPMLVADALVIAWLVARRRHRGVRPLTVVGFAVVAVAAVLASQVMAATPPLTDAHGRRLFGGIATLERIDLNGSEQWITIRGHDRANPVLLDLGTGDLGEGGFVARGLFEPLEDSFTIVSWDQPGTGKSYGAVPFDKLGRERYVADAVALTEHLRQRFGQDRIYLYGSSWSSVLGVWLVQEHPELYRAYVSSGQVVNTTANDRMGYDLALQHLDQTGQHRQADRLRSDGPPPYRGEDMLARYLAYRGVLNEMMGGHPLSVVTPLAPFLAPEYGYLDKVNYTRGLVESFTAVYPQLEDVDLVHQAPALKVPVYFLAGRQDLDATASLVQGYYDALSAPHKELVWLDDGQGVDAGSQGQFVDLMVNKVLVASG